MGPLPDVARDLHVDILQAGLLVTGYAVGVIIGAAVAFAACLVGLFSIYLARRQGRAEEQYEPEAVEAAPAE